MTYNNFKQTTIRGALRNEDYSDSSILASGYFQRDVQIDGVLTCPTIDDIITNITNIETDIDVIDTNITDIETEILSIETNISTINTNISTINTNITDIETDVATINTNITDIETDVATVNTNISTINTNITNIETDVATINTNITDIETEISTINTTIADITTIQTDIFNIETDIDAIDTNITNINIEIANIESDITTNTSSITTANTNIATNTSSISTANTNISNLDSNKLPKISPTVTSGDLTFSSSSSNMVMPSNCSILIKNTDETEKLRIFQSNGYSYMDMTNTLLMRYDADDYSSYKFQFHPNGDFECATITEIETDITDLQTDITDINTSITDLEDDKLPKVNPVASGSFTLTTGNIYMNDTNSIYIQNTEGTHVTRIVQSNGFTIFDSTDSYIMRFQDDIEDAPVAQFNFLPNGVLECATITSLNSAISTTNSNVADLNTNVSTLNTQIGIAQTDIIALEDQVGYIYISSWTYITTNSTYSFTIPGTWTDSSLILNPPIIRILFTEDPSNTIFAFHDISRGIGNGDEGLLLSYFKSGGVDLVLHVRSQNGCIAHIYHHNTSSISFPTTGWIKIYVSK